MRRAPRSTKKGSSKVVAVAYGATHASQDPTSQVVFPTDTGVVYTLATTV
jgi:hypothetical protein